MATSHNYRDLTGVRIEAQKLTVVSRSGTNPSGHVLWRCVRDDGREVLRTGGYLLGYQPALRVPKPPRERVKKPKKANPERDAWYGLIARCTKPGSNAYPEYGGRGIRVCERWLGSFEAFLSDVGPRPGKGYSLDRIDVDGHYEPGNVRWATAKEQNRNQRSNRRLTYGGETLTVAGWAEKLGIPAGRIGVRALAGLPIEEVLRVGRRPIPKHTKKRHERHGFSGTPEYQTWKAMVDRCTNPKHPAWRNYGGRGIGVWPAWVASFESFWHDVPEHPGPGYSLDRIDNERGYEPGNVRWASTLEQANNNRRNRLLSYGGRTQTLAQWGRELGLPVERIRSRLRAGWSVERALGT